MTRYLLNDIKKSRLIVIVLWLVYASAYFCRTCYSAAIASVVTDGVYDKGQIGLVGTAFFICYCAVSQKSGWNTVVVIWIISALLTSLFVFSANKKWNKFIINR